MSCPGDDGVQDDRGPVDDGEFVEASGQTPPLFQVAEPAFDYIAAAVVDRIERRGPSTACAPSAAVPGLIGGFGDHRADSAAPQQFPVGSGRVGLVAADPVRPGAWPSTAGTRNPQMVEQMRKGR